MQEEHNQRLEGQVNKGKDKSKELKAKVNELE